MSDYVLSVILGVIEGLTEFLPVSSTAHLRIAEALMHVDLESGYWKMYSIVIQLGAVLCLPIYFRKRLTKFVSTFPRGENNSRNILNHPVTLTLVAFVITAGAMFVLKKVVDKNLESLKVMGISLLVGGVIMWVVDAMFTKPTTQSVDEMNLPQAMWVGACQILSGLFPGTSRSMSTIAAGQIAGMSRPAALEFSFFLSIPTMFAATLYDLYKTLRPKAGTPEALAPVHVDTQGWITLGIGFVVSFIVAIVVVHFFMGWVRKRGFVPFAIYRILLGAGVLVYVFRQ